MDRWRGARGRPLIAGTLVIAGLFVASIALLRGQPASGALVHVLYLPVLLAAVLLKTPGGALAGVIAGLVAGPIAGSGEPFTEWGTRAVIFTVVGGLFGATQSLLDRRLQHGHELIGKISTVHARTLSTFASTVDLRDKPTSGHSSRVAHNARAIAIGLGLGHETVRAVYWSGLLHDLGKIAVPERILQKPAALSDDEFTTIRRHSDIGANLLLSVSPDLRVIAEGVRAHHERWDGTGYPRGIRGDDIPLVGRIVSIVDVFEALTCTRPYRQPRPVDEVLAYVREKSGSWFDPALVPLLEDLYWKGDIYTAAAVRTQLPVEEPAVVIPNDPIEESLLRAVTARDHHGQSGRP